MSSSSALRLLLVAVAMTAAIVGVGAVTGSVPGSAPRGVGEAPQSEPVAPSAEVRAAAILGEWDALRAQAWAAGDVRRLRSLYTPGSQAGARDVEMLRRWLGRGLVVRDLSTQVLALREVRRADGRLVLRVTDRLSAGTAVGRGASRRLPRDSATTTTVTLRRLDGRWLVESVSPPQS